MSDIPNTTPPADAPKKGPHENSLQDTKLANEIGQAGRLVETAQTKPAIAKTLAALGYDAKEVAEGARLKADAQKKFDLRQAAMATAGQDLAARNELDEAATDELSTFRQTVQSLYKGKDRSNLGASGRVSYDIEVFDTNTRSAYATALTEPYATKLATRAFGLERIKQALGTLDRLKTANTTAKASQKAAEAATKTRNQAGKAMNEWVAGLRKIVRANLKKYPELNVFLVD